MIVISGATGASDFVVVHVLLRENPSGEGPGSGRTYR